MDMLYECSESQKEISPALVKAQIAMTKAKKNSENPHFNSRFADLTAVLDAVLPALNDAGIALLQPPVEYSQGEPPTVKVVTILRHTSGEWMHFACEWPVGKNDIQGVGSIITYAKRYMLTSIMAIGTEDDDGNSNVFVITNKKGMCIINCGVEYPVKELTEDRCRKALEAPCYAPAHGAIRARLNELVAAKNNK